MFRIYLRQRRIKRGQFDLCKHLHMWWLSRLSCPILRPYTFLSCSISNLFQKHFFFRKAAWNWSWPFLNTKTVVVVCLSSELTTPPGQSMDFASNLKRAFWYWNVILRRVSAYFYVESMDVCVFIYHQKLFVVRQSASKILYQPSSITMFDVSKIKYKCAKIQKRWTTDECMTEWVRRCGI